MHDSDGQGQDRRREADFLAGAIEHFGGPSGRMRVLDFGCGQGGLVDEFAALGYEMEGGDFAESLGYSSMLAPISRSPYRLPFDDETFDVVVSTCVFEHAQNTEECFREISRVLRPGGLAMHVFPAKWRLPWENHTRLPLASWLWPRRPRWWLALWAIAGVRNPHQTGKNWREVVALDDRYIRDGLCYRSSSRYDAISRRVFSDWRWPMRYYIEHAGGGAARLAARLPWRSVTGRVLRKVRMAFLGTAVSGRSRIA